MLTLEKEGRLENTRSAFGEELLNMARNGYDVIGIAADTSKSMCLDLLQKQFPDRVFEVGIAEQNMMMVAAGLATLGKIPFATSYSVFTSMRAVEQLRTFIAYPNLNVKIVAGLGGFSAGIEGPTHVALEDLGIIACIPNICLINPADAPAVRKAVLAAADYSGPVYLRIGRNPSPVIFSEDYDFQIGRANLLRDDGDDLSILATGFPVFQALLAADALKKEGIRTKLWEIHTLKPIDQEAILEAVRKTGAILIVQDHYRTGALASIVAEILVTRQPTPVEIVAVEDHFTETATPEELRELYGPTVERIVLAARKLAARKVKT